MNSSRDAVQQDVDDGRLRVTACRRARSRRREFDGGGAADVCMELAALAEDAAPDDGAGLQTPFRVPPPRRKYMGGWRSLEALA